MLLRSHLPFHKQKQEQCLHLLTLHLAPSLPQQQRLCHLRSLAPHPVKVLLEAAAIRHRPHLALCCVRCADAWDQTDCGQTVFTGKGSSLRSIKT